MKKGLLVFFSLCALAAAMVPRKRESSSTISTSTTVKPQNICAAGSPCAWANYVKRGSGKERMIQFIIMSDECECGASMDCQRDEDNTELSAFVFHCKPLLPNQKKVL